MSTSLRAFKVGLIEEHLEEASFLYAQRRALLEDPGISWIRIDDFEQRLEAHVDALVLGGDLALEIAHKRAGAADSGELFAAVCVCCRHGRAPLLAEILRTLNYENSEHARAVGDALKYELPESWREPCLRAVDRGADTLRRVLAVVIGYRRVPAVLAPLLEGASEQAQDALLWAIGRTREEDALDAVRPLYAATSESLQSTALRTGLRLHDSEALRHLHALTQAGRCVPIELALAGGRSAVPTLVARLQGDDPGPVVIAGLGLLGDLSSVRYLLELLSVESLASSAAEALHVITGAPLFENVLVPEQFTEDELFDKELREYRATAELPKRGDGEPLGTRVVRLSVDPAKWQAWMQSNAAHFKADMRYRGGRPYSPVVLLGCLQSETFPKSYRGLVAEELLVRYGVDLRFEDDMPVATQRSILREAATTVGDLTPDYDAGRWYTFGRP